MVRLSAGSFDAAAAAAVATANSSLSAVSAAANSSCCVFSGMAPPYRSQTLTKTRHLPKQRRRQLATAGCSKLGLNVSSYSCFRELWQPLARDNIIFRRSKCLESSVGSISAKAAAPLLPKPTALHAAAAAATAAITAAVAATHLTTNRR